MHTFCNDVKSSPYCWSASSYPRIFLPHNITSIKLAVYRPITQTSSATLEEVFVIQPCIRVGINGMTTGDHKTSTMPTNPRILRKETRIVELMNKYWAQNTISTTDAYIYKEKHYNKPKTMPMAKIFLQKIKKKKKKKKDNILQWLSIVDRLCQNWQNSIIHCTCVDKIITDRFKSSKRL